MCDEDQASCQERMKPLFSTVHNGVRYWLIDVMGPVFYELIG